MTPDQARERGGLIGALLIAVALIGLVWMFSGCAGWQHTAAKVVLGVEGGADAAKTFLAQPCSPAAMKLAVDECIAKKDAACPALKRCELATKSLHSLYTAALLAKLAIQAGDEGKASAAVNAALQAIPPVMRAVEVWR